MDSTRTTQDLPFAVLSDDELDSVVGGADLKNFNAQDYVNNKIGMCGCGLAH